MSGLFANGINALKFGFSTCAKKIIFWLIMTIILIIPIVNFIGLGVLLKVLRGEEPLLDDIGKRFVQGLLAFVIILIYSIIPAIIYFVTGGLGIVGTIISIIIFILFYLFMVPTLVNFARKENFGAAFAFGDIMGYIKSLGTGKYILSYVVCTIICLIIGLILGVIGLIPAIGSVIQIILTIIILAPMAFFLAKYWHDIFA